MSADELRRMLNRLALQEPYEGYPFKKNRLFIQNVVITKEYFVVPDGPWHVANHPNRRGVAPAWLDIEVPAKAKRVSEEYQQRWKREGLRMDQYGRPIHPYWKEALSDLRVGLPTGFGFFYRYGPNKTVDAVVYRKPENRPVEYLLIKRRDDGLWALPGGFRDATDIRDEAVARRKVAEATGLADLGGSAECLVSRVSLGPRDTLHAWAANSVLMMHGNRDYLLDVPPVCGDDAVDVGWFTASEILTLDLHGAHRYYIGMVYRRFNQ